jgi:hypothetical protein
MPADPAATSHVSVEAGAAVKLVAAGQQYKTLPLISLLVQAMASAFYFCVLEAVMSVVDASWHDHFMMRGFDVMLTCTIIFAGIGTFAGGIFYQWRCQAAEKTPSIFKLCWDNIKW